MWFKLLDGDLCPDVYRRHSVLPHPPPISTPVYADFTPLKGPTMHPLPPYQRGDEV